MVFRSYLGKDSGSLFSAGSTPRIWDPAMGDEVSIRFPGERLTVDGDYATWKFITEAYFLAQGMYENILGLEVAPEVPETGAMPEQKEHWIPGANEISELWYYCSVAYIGPWWQQSYLRWPKMLTHSRGESLSRSSRLLQAECT